MDKKLNPTEKANFTKAFIEAIELPAEGQRAIFRDAKVPGLQLRVTANGIKTFFSRRRIKGGESERITLGRFPDMSIEQARKKADAVNAEVSEGKNPAEVKRALRAELTFGELFNDYLDRHAKIKKRLWEKEEGRYHLYLEKPLGKKRLSDISRDDIKKLHDDVTKQIKIPKQTKKTDDTKKKEDKKPEYKSGATANRVLALASTVFTWGIDSGECVSNPAKGIKRYKERSRERFLQADEMPKFFEALSTEPNPDIRDYVLLSLLTGARRGNVLSMRWDDVSFERKEWRITLTKNNQPQTVPLGAETLEVLKSRKIKQEKQAKKDKETPSDFVFPGEGKTGHLIEPCRGWVRILKSAGIKDLHLHDLRRTFGSWQARTGASLIVIGKSLNHKSQATTQIYSRLDLDPVRKSVETATSAILEAAGVKKTAKVTMSKKKGVK